jgi:hypothetical protein
MIYQWLAGVGAVAIVTAVGMTACDVAQAAELVQREEGYNWQDREYFGRAYTERQIGGGDADAAAAGDSAGDAGASAGAGSGGDSGEGDGCGR